MIVALTNMLTHEARLIQGMPVGMVLDGRNEAFYSTWCVHALLRMHDNFGLRCKLFSLPDGLLARIRVIVINGNACSSLALPESRVCGRTEAVSTNSA